MSSYFVDDRASATSNRCSRPTRGSDPRGQPGWPRGGIESRCHPLRSAPATECPAHPSVTGAASPRGVGAGIGAKTSDASTSTSNAGTYTSGASARTSGAGTRPSGGGAAGGRLNRGEDRGEGRHLGGNLRICLGIGE